VCVSVSVLFCVSVCLCVLRVCLGVCVCVYVLCVCICVLFFVSACAVCCSPNNCAVGVLAVSKERTRSEVEHVL